MNIVDQKKKVIEIILKRFMGFFGLFLSIVVLIFSCERGSESKAMRLDANFDQIDFIKSVALCDGPNGNYITTVESSKNGSLRFIQEYDYRDLPFIAQIISTDEAYSLDAGNNILDTLDQKAMAMIRSHDFHRIQISPQTFFQNIQFEKELDQLTDIFVGQDRLNNPVQIHYNNEKERVEKVEMLNPTDTTESIEIFYSLWKPTEHGELAYKVEIIQARKDTFTFNFQNLETYPAGMPTY